MSNEQWKNGGDCKECRRRRYCSKECTQHKKYRHRRMKEALYRNPNFAVLGEGVIYMSDGKGRFTSLCKCSGCEVVKGGAE